MSSRKRPAPPARRPARARIRIEPLNLGDLKKRMRSDDKGTRDRARAFGLRVAALHIDRGEPVPEWARKGASKALRQLAEHLVPKPQVKYLDKPSAEVTVAYLVSEQMVVNDLSKVRAVAYVAKELKISERTIWRRLGGNH